MKLVRHVVKTESVSDKEEYCKYCQCSYKVDNGLPIECNGDCGENPHEFEGNDEFKELKF